MPHIKESAELLWYEYPCIKRWLNIIACPFYSPFRCCRGCINPFRGPRRRCGTGQIMWAQEKRERKQRRVSEIRQARRERALEVPKRNRSLSVDVPRPRMRWQRAKVAGEQSQSLLFSKLPAELRIEIWALVLCDTGRLDIGFRMKDSDALNLRSVICVDPYDHFEEPLRGRLQWPDLHSWWEGDGPESRTSLLRTCKRVYREAISLLYSEPVFSFHDSEAFRVFSRSVLSKRLAQIRHIIIEQRSLRQSHGFHGYVRPVPWLYPVQIDEITRILPALSNLVSLRLDFHVIHVNSAERELAEVFVAAEKYDGSNCRIEARCILNGPPNEYLINGRWPLNQIVTLRDGPVRGNGDDRECCESV